MTPHARASLLWGVVGGLSFLVLAQGYELLAGAGITVGVKAGVALAVAAGAAAATYGLGNRLPGNESP